MTVTPSSQVVSGIPTAAIAASLAPIDTDRALSGITALATRMLRVPIAIVSLFEGNDEVVLSGRGAPLAAAGRRWPLADAMCREMVTTQRRVVYGNARRDAALRERPAVTTHGVVAYAGSPLSVSGGRVAGALCVVDTQPREWTDDELQLLDALAAAAWAHLELSHRVAELEREQAEHDAAQREAELWTVLMDHLPDPIYFKDEQSRFTRINRAQARVLGVADPADAIGKTDADYFPAHAEQALADERQVMASGEPMLSKIERLIDPRGRERWFSATKMPLRDASGAVIGTMGSSREITDVMQAEVELRGTLSLLTATLESTADGILVVDLEGRVTSYNRKFAVMWRIPEDVLATRQDDASLRFAREQLKDAEGYQRRVQELYADPEASSFDVLELRDGRLFERYSQPQRIGGAIVGRVWSFRDVSERKRAEEESRLLAHTVQSTRDIISITDMDGRFTFVNRAFLSAYGYTETDVLGQPVSMIDSSRNSAALQLEIRRATTAGGWRGELWNRRKDGSEFPIALTTSQIRDPQGRVVGLVGVWNDITQRRRAESVQQATYRIADAATSARNLDDLLQAVHRIVGELMAAQNFFVALYDPAQNLLTFPYFVDQVDVVDAPGPPRRGLTEYVIRSGRPLLGTPEVVLDLERRGEIELVGAPSVDWLGVPLKVGTQTIGVLVVQSYTQGVRYGLEDLEILEFVSAQVAMAIERTRAAGRLQQSEAKYRLLFEASPQVMFVYDADTLRFLAVNEAAVRRYGYSREQFLAMSVLDIRPEAEHAKLLDILQRHTGGVGRATGLKHRTRDGAVIDVEVTFDDLEFEGRRARLALVEDVTEQRRLEDQLRQAQKMEAVGQLAGGIAHDFNNLLTAIVGYATLLDRSLTPEAAERQDVREILGAARRAAGLTQQLLAFSRKQVLRPAVLDINVVVRDMERMLHRVIGEHIELVTVLAPGAAPVLADSGQLQQVILNLAVNARDAMPRGGRLTIETEPAQLDEAFTRGVPDAMPGEYVCLRVTDSGVGMTPDIMAHIFEPFFTTKEVGKGTGLGLATVYGIVRQSGGLIDVDSVVGRGTTFRINLPRVGTHGASVHGARVSGPRNAAVTPPVVAATVMLVEDETGVRHLAREVLTRSGYRVLEAANGTDALRVAEQHSGSIDLLLTDVVMPGMSGAELAGRFLAIRPGTKVLYASGYTDEAVLDHGLRHDAVPFLQKPFEPDELVRRVTDILKSEDPATPAA